MAHHLPAAGGDGPVIADLLPATPPATCLENASATSWWKSHTDRHLRALATKVGEKCGLAMRRTAPLLMLLAVVAMLPACAHRGKGPESAEPGMTQKGEASWYGRPYHGRRTASGEIYDMYALTAAHRTLPFGTRVEVTRRDNHRSVVVRINDRGPFVKHRIIDLSYAAARKIGLDVDGVAPVTIRVLSAGERPRTSRTETTPPRPPTGEGPDGESRSSHECYWVQVGAFSEHAHAVKVRDRLEAEGHHALIMDGPSGLERVRLGPFESRDAATSAREAVHHEWPAATVVPCG